MQTLGQKFKAAREARGLTVETIAAQTRINPAYLHAIEADDQSQFPGAFFYRSFIRQYGAVLELPENSYAAELERSMSQQAETLASLPSQIPERQIQVAPLPGGKTYAPEDTRRWLMRIAGLALVLLGCSGIYALWQRGVLDGLFSAAAPAPAASVAAPEPKPVPPPVVEAKPAVTEPPPALPAPEAKPAETGETRLKITATEISWLEVRSGGRILFSDALKPGDAREFASREPIRVRYGNAGGVQVEHQGKAIPAPGQRGEVATFAYTPQGVFAPAAAPQRD